ncbi:WS/DGAT domain-containing protein, partial [Streptomyces sp. DSM 41978]|uniref:WS/DGAT domain-containing protein n=1 Tax=Streptomyces sp. DSM 41978 TaxID=3448658 RepID=UPI00403FE9E3
MRVAVPAGTTDPRERIAEIHRRTSRARGEKSLGYTDLIAAGLNTLPRCYIGSELRHVDFVASDVPGFPLPLRLGGIPVQMQYAFSPTLGASVNATLLSYVDTCAIGINVDTGAIPDYRVFRDCLAGGFEETVA